MSDYKEVKSAVVSWGKVGDNVEGTLTDIRPRDVQDQKKGLIRKNVYEIKTDAGQFHALDDKKNPVEPPIKCEPGDYYTLWGGKDVIDNVMRKAKIGQKVKFVFAEETPSNTKGNYPFKLIKGYLGAMDDEWLKEQEPMPTE